MVYDRLNICFLILFIGCESTTDPKVEILQTHNEVLANGVVYALNIQKPELSLTDSLSLTFQVTNKTDSVKVFWFANQQQLGYDISDSKDSVVTWFPGIVQPAFSNLTVQPGAVKEFNITNPLKNIYGNYIAKGRYRLSVFLMDNNSPKVSLQINVN